VIAEVRGSLTAKHGDLVTIMTAGGVGYEVTVPLGVLERLPRPGGEVRLHTMLVVREDSWALFGFDQLKERAVFQRLLVASGVGPRLALSLLSALGAERVVRAVQTEDLAVLCTVPGVGKKKAERMVLELKDRMRDLEVASEQAAPAQSTVQAVTALVNLGYSSTEADAAVRAVVAGGTDADSGTLIRDALQRLTRGK
jgi:Holliday junction DNA helicase RuvA